MVNRRKEYDKRYYLKNKEKIAAYRRAWYQEHRDEYLEKSRRKRMTDPGYRKYAREKARAWREKNKARHTANVKAYQLKNRDKIKEYQRSYHLKRRALWFKIMKDKFGVLACSKCGYNRCVDAIDFHHKDPTQKELRLSILRRRIPNKELVKELDKGVLLCSNCHRETHAELKAYAVFNY